MTTASEQLIDTLAARGFDDLPPEVVHEAKRLVLDFIGVGLSGSQTETGRILRSYAASQSASSESTVLGNPDKASAVNAAFANAISSHSVELDDVDEEALFHHGPPIVASALAVAEREHRSGKDFLRAVVAGCETMTRVSQATNNTLRDRGFHTTPTTGVFGAAVASGLLLGLTPAQLVSAMGLAGAQSSGLMEMYGTSMQKRFNPGPAARDGVTSALLAQAGFTGADSILDGVRGFGAAFAGGLDLKTFLNELGSRILMTVEYKPYSCARPIHTAIDAMLMIKADHALTADEIESITVLRHPSWAHYHDISTPKTFHEAQVSLPYSVGLALVVGKALPAQYELVGNGDDAVMAVSELVEIVSEPSLLRGVSCRIVVRTKDGRELTAEVDYPKGSIQAPMSDEVLGKKFRDLGVQTIDESRLAELEALIMNLENVADVGELTSLLTPREAAARS